MKSPLQPFIDETPQNWVDVLSWDKERTDNWYMKMDPKKLASFYPDILSHPQSKELVEKWAQSIPQFLAHMAMAALKKNDIQAAQDILLNKQNWDIRPSNLLFMTYLVCLANPHENKFSVSQYQALLSPAFTPLLTQLIEKDFLKSLGLNLLSQAPKELTFVLNHPLVDKKQQNGIFSYALIKTPPHQWEDALLQHPMLLKHFHEFVQRNKNDYAIMQKFILTHDKKWENVRKLLFAQTLKKDLSASSSASLSKKM